METTERSRGISTSYISGAIVVLLNVLFFEGYNDPIVQSKLERWRSERQQRAARLQQMQKAKFDPKVGSRLTLFDQLPEPLRGRERTVLFLSGACSGCSLGHLHKFEPFTDNRVKVVAVVKGTQSQVDGFWKELDLRVPAVADPEGRWMEACNAYFAPRLYAVNAAGDLVWIQPYGMSLTEAPTRAVGSR